MRALRRCAPFVVAAVLALDGVVPAHAQTARPDGMVADPCPPRQPEIRLPLGEPGRVPTYDPAMIAKYVEDTKHRADIDWAWVCRYRAADREIASAHTARVVFMGDSITENWVRYDGAFFKDANIGRGISGQTSPQMLVRFYQDVISLRPAVVHILAGTNDVAGNTGPTSPDAYQNMIRSMVELAKAHHIRVVLGSIPPAGHFPWKPQIEPAATIRKLNAWLRSYAQESGAIYADYYSAMVAPDGGLKPSYTFDGVHPATEGYRVMRAIAERAIGDALARPRR